MTHIRPFGPPASRRRRPLVRPDSSARIASPGKRRADGVDHERLGQVVGLGHDVRRALVVDPLEPLVAVHQDRPAAAAVSIANASSARPHVGATAATSAPLPAAGSLDVGHGPVHATASGRSTLPNGDSWSKVTVVPGRDLRAVDELGVADARDRPDRSAGRSAYPASAVVASRSRVAITRRPAGRRDRCRPAWNGPIPVTARRAEEREHAIATPTARNDRAVDLRAARSLSPSGLQRSHSPTSSGTGAPQRTQPWVSSVAAAERRAGHLASMVPRIGATGRPARVRPTSARRRRPARRRRRSCGRARSPRRRPPRASAPTSRAGRGTQSVSASRSSPSQSPWKPTRTRWSSRRRPVASSASR